MALYVEPNRIVIVFKQQFFVWFRLMTLFLRVFQSITSAFDNSSYSTDQDINQFLVYTGIIPNRRWR